MDKGVEKHATTRPKKARKASGKPGKKPTWSSGAKTLVGTAACGQSRLWFTVANGAINEIYFPDVDQANTRSIRFLVTDGKGFFSDEQWDADHKVEWLAEGVPGCRIESRCKQGRYTITKELITDPIRDTLIMHVQFHALDAESGLKLYLFVEPHMGDRGANNDAWVGAYKGVTMLLAQRDRACLAVTVDPTFRATSCGYSGKTDAASVLSKFKPFPDVNLAEDGNITLAGEIDWTAKDGRFTVALGCGSSEAEAAQQARAGLLQVFDTTRKLFIEQWQKHQEQYLDVEDLSGRDLDMYRVSTAVLETHQSKRFPGAFIASLSLPWGFSRSDKDIGGYHVLWPRDMVETAMGKFASGDAKSARSALFYLSCTQDAEGSWSQNMWLDGTMHWGAVQMDGMALPILLADKLKRENELDEYDPTPMVTGAAKFLLKNGPVSQQGRWEAVGGYSVYTVATEVAALLAAADIIEAKGNTSQAEFLRRTADAWNDSVEELLYVAETQLARKYGAQGYYVRVSPSETIERQSMDDLLIVMPNLPFGFKHQKAMNILSPDALALVRFGLRAADDPRVLDTIKVMDATLKRETKTGPGWVRSTKDGYGETKDGSPFKKHGIGRVWPLLAGERAHYEIAAGNREYALELLRTMARQTSEAGMIPEQIWDANDIPEKFLFNGHPAGSGMPLVWAHSEYIKLLRSLHGGAIWDLPPQPVQRYQVEKRTADFQIWTTKQRRGWLAQGKNLRVDLNGPAKVEWTIEDATYAVSTTDTGLDLHTVMLPLAGTAPGMKISVKVQPDSKDGALKADSFTVQVRSE